MYSAIGTWTVSWLAKYSRHVDTAAFKIKKTKIGAYYNRLKILLNA
jgi:hypothetical protein